MCGIVFNYQKKGIVNHKTLFSYINQRTRGTEGFGLITYPNNKIKVFKQTSEQAILTDLMFNRSNFCLFHHRQPTSTENIKNACHPFKIEIDNRIFYTIHNGWITNDDTLFAEYSKNYKITSLQKDGRFNDSEILAIDITQYITGKQKEIKSQGAIAFITLETDLKGNQIALWYGRNSSSPLNINFNSQLLEIASEKGKLQIAENILYRFDFQKWQISEQSVKFSSGYHYTNNYFFHNDIYYMDETELQIELDKIRVEIIETQKRIFDLEMGNARKKQKKLNKAQNKLETLQYKELEIENLICEQKELE